MTHNYIFRGPGSGAIFNLSRCDCNDGITGDHDPSAGFELFELFGFEIVRPLVVRIRFVVLGWIGGLFNDVFGDPSDALDNF